MAGACIEEVCRSNVDERLEVVLDIETGDPDNFVIFVFLLGHPKVNLKVVTIVPGTPDQIGFLRYVLHRFNRDDFPLGAFNMNAKPGLSKFHLKIYDNTLISESRDALDGYEILLKYCDEKTTLICGGPLKMWLKRLKKEDLNWVD